MPILMKLLGVRRVGNNAYFHNVPDILTLARWRTDDDTRDHLMGK